MSAVCLPWPNWQAETYLLSSLIAAQKRPAGFNLEVSSLGAVSDHKYVGKNFISTESYEHMLRVNNDGGNWSQLVTVLE